LKLMTAIPKLNQVPGWGKRYASELGKDELYVAARKLHDNMIRFKLQQASAAGVAGHYEKRHFVSSHPDHTPNFTVYANLLEIFMIGLRLKPVSITERLRLLAEGKVPDCDTAGLYTPPIIVWRDRIKSNVPLRTTLAETNFRPQDHVANAETGYYIVAPDVSVIFLSKTTDETGLPYLITVNSG